MADHQGERPLFWIVLPAVLVALVELLRLLYFVASTLDEWRFLPPFRALEVVHRAAVLAGTVGISTIAIAVPMLLLAPRDWIRELGP